MPCTRPLLAHRSTKPNENGKYPLLFSAPDTGYDSRQKESITLIQVSCGACRHCRKTRTKEWSIRCMNEAEYHEENSFITLTYSDKYIPNDYSLNHEHFQKFMKRLRYKMKKEASHASPRKIRYYMAGEYGEQTERPHYHAIIFGWKPKDIVNLFRNKNGQSVGVSAELQELWLAKDKITGKYEAMGHCTVGTVTEASANYVAQYCQKKVTGDQAPDHYQGRKPEYSAMSINPPIGSIWYDQYKSDIYPNNYYTLQGGIKAKIPKIYKNKLKLTNTEEYDIHNLDNQLKANQYMLSDENQPNRLRAKDEVLKSKQNLNKRKLK